MSDIPLVPSLWRFPAHLASVAHTRRAVAETLPQHLLPRLVDHLATTWTVRPRPTRGTSVIAGLRLPG
ncbi:hypothetical protein [Streptomyces sp. NPDC021020]|uniref:hypothetical protein n=1 Tax=Streptomyces sp. NPDC021020 TaxID=3365109 RepID=UPI0037977407